MTTRGKWLDNRLHKNRTVSKLISSPDEDIAQYFQVSVNVLEAKRLAWANPSLATSYVMLVLDNVKYRTSVRQNMKVPFYRENFVFELFTSVKQMQRTPLWLAVMETQSCGAPRLLGEASVELAYVWEQPHHTVSHKWARLTRPTDAENSPVGYLKVDISITYRGEMLATPGGYQGRMEEDILFPHGSEQPASYQVTLYRAYSVPSTAQSRPHMLGKPPNTRLQVTFCGLTGETSIQYRNNDPVYGERVSIVEMFPNACQLVRLEVCLVNGGTKVLASTQLKLPQISHKGDNGFLPTYGPSLLHMYGPWSSESTEEGPYYRGALLVAMKTVVPYYKHALRTVTVEPVMATVSEMAWIFEDFVLFCPIFEVSMLDKRVSGEASGVAITVGDIPCSSSVDQEFVRQMCEINQKKLHYTGPMAVTWANPTSGYLKFETYPVLQQASRLPDFRFRMYRNNVLHGIVTDLENELSNISARLVNEDFNHLKELLESLHRSKDDTAAKILKFLDIIQYSTSNEDIHKYSTELDRRTVELQKEKIGKIYRRIISKSHNTCTPHLCTKSRLCEDGNYKKLVKRMLAQGRSVVQDLKDLIFKTPDGWPDIAVWLLSNGSRIAHAKIVPADIIHSVIPEQSGPCCGKIHTIYFKPIKCPKHPNSRECCCIAGKVELLAWLGAFRQRASFQSSLPVGYQFSTEEGLSVHCEPLGVECCVNIYRAKLNYTSDPVSLCPFVRVNFMNDVKDTEVRYNTVNPVWSEVLRISCLSNTSPGRLEGCPPEMLVEVYHWDTMQTDKICLIGRLSVTPVFVDSSELAPALKWLDVHMGPEHVGKIQMSAQLTQTAESVMTETWLNAEQDLTQRSSYQVAQLFLNSDGREPLPVNLLPANNTYKIDVYWWGLRDVSIAQKPCMILEFEDVIIKSTIITECKPNCNFPNDRISQTFQGDLTNGGSPLTVKLYDSTTFGRTLFVGLNVVKRPQKYVVNWIPKKEREELLFSRPIVSNAFMQVNRTTLVKRHAIYPIFEHPEETFDYKEEESSKITSLWGRIFPKKADEEQITLLPIFFKERQTERQNVVKKTEDDWWKRYYASLNDRASSDKEPSGNRLTIYDSELERQPGFSRFKDWCSTIKIYNGSKTGIPEKDNQLLCGFLKASIVVYSWPPPASTVAVSNSGVDLDKGYFDGYSDNDPTRYLVRVYAVKCSGLVSKGFTTTSKCYVSVQCGVKELGDVNSCVLRSSEPVFGKMFELQCTFPEDYLLKVLVKDYGPTLPDSLIGSTIIDLEDRAYSRHRSTVGLAAEYNINGPNKWRDSQRPSAILEQLCDKNHLPPPEFPDPSTVLLNGVEYKDLESGTKYASPVIRKESICLSILHKWHTLPICGYKLVPEHVEARALYDPQKPGVEQGKIHLWIDMFLLDCGRLLPPPVDITPLPAEDYELRVIVWEVQDVKLVNRGSNIYVKAWIGPSDEAQDTDIYYTSLNGEGYFNWRMVFQFQYRHTERKLLLHDKGPFTEVTELFPPILIVQVLDIEAPNPEDFLGTLMLNLSAMPRSARSARQCTPDIMRRHEVDLFSARSVRGWWPMKMIDRNTGNYYFAGMIDLEMSLLPKEKAQLMPVGLGRDPPAPLPDPMRQPRDTASVWSLGQYNHRTPALVALGLLCVGACVYWDLPVMVLDGLNVLERSRTI